MSDSRVILVFAPDDYLLSVKAKEVLDALVPESERMFGLEVVDCAVETVDSAKKAIYKVCNGLIQDGFLCESKTVWMKNVTFCGTDRTSKAESLKDALHEFEEFIEEKIPEGVTLLITTSSLAKTSSLYKRITKMAKSATAIIHEIPELTGRDLIEQASILLEEHTKANGYPAMSSGVRAAFLDRCGSLPRNVVMEFEKLMLYTDGKEPTLDDVDAVVTLNRGGDPWNLTDAFGEHNLRKTIKVLRNLYEMRIEPIFLVIQLQGRVNELLLIRDAMDRGQFSSKSSLAWSSGISKEDREAVAGLGKFDVSSKHPWAQGRLIAQAANWQRISLRKARMNLLTAHERMVSITVNPRSVLELSVVDALR